jgi:hypothetical protein
MSYTRHSFTDYKTVIDAKLLGEMDVGIEDAHNNLDGITVSLEGTREENGRKIEAYKMTLPNGKTFDFELKDGEKGDAGNVNINDKTPLRFFAGTKAEYDDLPDKTNVFAIITDDPTQIGLIDKINGFIDGSIPIPNIEQTYVRKDEQKIYQKSVSRPTNKGSVFEIGDLPDGKTSNDIVGMSVCLGLSFKFNLPVSGQDLSHEIDNLIFQGGKSFMRVLHPDIGTRFVLNAMSYESSTSEVVGLVNPLSTATLDVTLLDEDGKLRIRFDDCRYSVFDENNFLSAKLSDNVFRFIDVIYWFA